MFEQSTGKVHNRGLRRLRAILCGDTFQPDAMVTATRARPPYRYLDSQREFDAFLKRIGKEPLLAVDTEAASFHRFVDRIYLIQVSTRSDTAIIDPLTVPDVVGLGSIIADPKVEAVFHDADYDLRILDRDYGFHARGLFDTRVAAQLLGEPAVGLAALLEKYVGVTLDKKYQRADWSRRPLPPEMLEYAATDTRYLLTLRERLRERLTALGRLAWAEEEFARLEGVRWTPPESNGAGFLRLKGARALDRRALAVLRELVAWREAIAADLDRASFRVVSNEVLVALATDPPRSVEALHRTRGLAPRLVAERGPSLLEAVGRALSLPDRDLPRFPRAQRRTPDPAFDQAVDRLKRVRNDAARRLALDPGVLCPKGTLEAVARARPKAAAALAVIPEVRRWQVEVLGPEFLKALES